MTNIVSFLRHVDEHSLVLFDELGAGTDPTEGAALAIAILDGLHRRGIRTMATTHYSELKVYALSTPGVENASCEFDVESLRPTYHLLIGIPGKSNAFAIAGKLGLPQEVIEEAKKHLSEQDESFEDLLTDLEVSRRTIEKEQDEIAAYRRELERLKEETQKRQEKLEEQRERILREANEKAHAILLEAKETADETMRNFHKFGKENISAADMEREREKLRKKMEAARSGMTEHKETPHKIHKPEDFKLGESVKVLSMNLTGTVVSLPDAKGRVTVQMGILRSQLPISDLEILEEKPVYLKKTARQTTKGKMKMGKSHVRKPGDQPSGQDGGRGGGGTGQIPGRRRAWPISPRVALLTGQRHRPPCARASTTTRRQNETVNHSWLAAFERATPALLSQNSDRRIN